MESPCRHIARNSDRYGSSRTKTCAPVVDPSNHALVLIDFEGQMAFAVKSIDIGALRDNVGLVAGGSKIFNVPTIVTTVAEKSFSGPVFPEVIEVYPDQTKYIDRTTMNTWEDKKLMMLSWLKAKRRSYLPASGQKCAS